MVFWRIIRYKDNKDSTIQVKNHQLNTLIPYITSGLTLAARLGAIDLTIQLRRIVPKSFCLRVTRLAKDYFRLYRSAKPMTKRLAEKQIKYAIKQCSKGRPTYTMAKELNVMQRRIRQSYAESCKTRTVHVQDTSGRKRKQIIRESKSCIRCT